MNFINVAHPEVGKHYRLSFEKSSPVFAKCTRIDNGNYIMDGAQSDRRGNREKAQILIPVAGNFIGKIDVITH